MTRPVLLAEVLSSSTESYDRGLKWQAYQGLPSLRTFLLVAQDRVSVEAVPPGSRGLDVQLAYATRGVG